MKTERRENLSRRSTLVGLGALGIAIASAGAAATALAASIVALGEGSAAAAAAVKKGSATKLTFGLDTLSSEYRVYRQAVASGTAKPGTFTSQETMATVIDEAVIIDAVAAEDAQALRTALELLGAEVTAVAGRMMSARVPLDRIPELQTLEPLQFARPALDMTRSGAVTSQGDSAQYSDLARTVFSVDGTGSTVGVLSDSFDCLGGYAADVATGDLPAGVDILDDTVCPGSDEGRAMAQIVTDVAPGARLAFHTAFNCEADFAQGIFDLAASGSTIIVDDVIYFAEPMFQDGVIAQAVDAVDAAGVPYFSSAGNNGREAYEAAFIGSGQTGPVGGELHDFDPGPGVDTRLTIQQNAATTYIMQWQDPFFSVSGPPGAGTDLDICVYFAVGAAQPLGYMLPSRSSRR